MAFIEALAAFALAMIVFGTMVTAIVELIHRTFRLRQRGLVTMIELLYEEALKGHATVAARNFAEDLVRKQGLRTASMMKWPPGRDWESALTPIEFVERLARTEVGRAIAAETKERRDRLVEDIALRFERFGDSTRAHFAGRAQLLAMAVAIPFALIANIPADRLFFGLLNNEPARAALLAAADQITAEFRTTTVQPAATHTTPQPEDARKFADDAQRTLADIRARLSDLAGKDLAIGWNYFPGCRVVVLSTKAEIERAKLERRVLDIRGEQGKATNQSFAFARADGACLALRSEVETKIARCLNPPAAAPATASPAPSATPVPAAPPNSSERKAPESCAQEAFSPWGNLVSVSGFQWVLASVLAGILIGLGGPFWFNVYASLSQFLQVAKAMRETLKPAEKAGGGASAAAGAAPGQAIKDGAIRPATPSEAFERAIVAGAVSSAGRIVPAWRADP